MDEAGKRSRDHYRKRIAFHLGVIEHHEGEIESIAREHVPDYHFMDYKLSNFWGCDESPVGWCVFALDENSGKLTIDSRCKFCGQPVERK